MRVGDIVIVGNALILCLLMTGTIQPVLVDSIEPYYNEESEKNYRKYINPALPHMRSVDNIQEEASKYPYDYKNPHLRYTLNQYIIRKAGQCDERAHLVQTYAEREGWKSYVIIVKTEWGNHAEVINKTDNGWEVIRGHNAQPADNSREFIKENTPLGFYNSTHQLTQTEYRSFWGTW